MTVSITADIADSVAFVITHATLSQAVTAVRKWRAKYPVKDLADTKVTVTPGPMVVDVLTRGENEDKRWVDVIVQKRVNPDDNTDVDPQILLVEDIAGELLRSQRVTTRGITYTVMGAKTVPANASAVEEEHLDGWRTFTAVLRLECWIQR